VPIISALVAIHIAAALKQSAREPRRRLPAHAASLDSRHGCFFLAAAHCPDRAQPGDRDRGIDCRGDRSSGRFPAWVTPLRDIPAVVQSATARELSERDARDLADHLGAASRAHVNVANAFVYAPPSTNTDRTLRSPTARRGEAAVIQVLLERIALCVVQVDAREAAPEVIRRDRATSRSLNSLRVALEHHGGNVAQRLAQPGPALMPITSDSRSLAVAVAGFAAVWAWAASQKKTPMTRIK